MSLNINITTFNNDKIVSKFFKLILNSRIFKFKIAVLNIIH